MPVPAGRHIAQGGQDFHPVTYQEAIGIPAHNFKNEPQVRIINGPIVIPGVPEKVEDEHTLHLNNLHFGNDGLGEMFLKKGILR